MKTWLFSTLGILFSAAMVIGCGQKEPSPTPVAGDKGELPAPVQRVVDSSQTHIDAQKAARTINEMYVLAQAGNWDTYVDRYYGETHKFTSEEDRKNLIDRFRSDWGPEVIKGLEQAATAKPEITGDTAVFKIGGRAVFQLYLGSDGEWKFHL